jgi:organic radical activating enzyme
LLYKFRRLKRYWKVGLSYGLKRTSVNSAPVNIHIETTNICNFRCIYCPQSVPDEHFKILGRGKMSFETYRQILEKIVSAWSLREIVLTRDGEPLVHPELEKFIAFTAGMGLDVTIGSNGSYFTPDRIPGLIDSGLTKVKGDFCRDKSKYEMLRVGGKWEKVLEGYRGLLDYAIRHDRRFHLVLVDLDTYDRKSPQEVTQSLKSMHELFPYPTDRLSINPAMMHNSFNEAKIVLSSSDKLRKRRYNLCHHPWIELVIDYRGNAVGCCRDLRSEYILGNILECSDIERDIWNGPAMQALRRALANQEPESVVTCEKCDLPYGISYAGRGRFRKMLRFLDR